MPDDPAAQRELPYLPPVVPEATGDVAGAVVTADAFAAFLADGEEEVARWALSRQLALRPRAVVYDTFVRDAMRLVGERWMSGRWTISEEHLASRTLARVLASVAPGPAPVDRLEPVAVLAGVAGEEHAIGLITLAHVLAEAGFAVHDLGPDVPADDLARYVNRIEGRLVALSAASAARLDDLVATVAALHALPSRPVVMVGGRISALTDLSRVGADFVGGSLVDCAAYARRLAPPGRFSGPS